MKKINLKLKQTGPLPSKVSVSQTLASSGENGNNERPQQQRTSITSKPPMSRSSIGNTQTSAKKQQQQALGAAYGNYLQNYLETALLKELQAATSSGQQGALAKNCVPAYFSSRSSNIASMNCSLAREEEKYLRVEKARPAFDNLIDFTGEETLTEISGSLSSKYDKLKVKGDVACREPLASESKMEGASKSAATIGTSNESVFQMCSQIVKDDKAAKDSLDDCNRESTAMKELKNVKVETCSLLACENAYNRLELNLNNLELQLSVSCNMKQNDGDGEK